MSVAEANHRPKHRGRAAKLWLSLAGLIAAGTGLAWIGAEPMRGETSASGVMVRTLESGQGDYVEAIDGVLIEYEGRLADGTVFDSSAGRGPTPMIAGQVIPGFAEALTRMQQGGRYTIRIPSELAYGSSPPPGSPIPPDADLDFDVEVVQIVPGAALISGPGAPGASAPEPQPGEMSEPVQPEPRR